MDAVINILLGACAGLVIAGWVRSRPAQRIKLMLTGMIGANLPSVDELSLWHEFDEYIAPLFGLEETGYQIYFSTAWYGHQGFFHSFLAGFLWSILIGFALSLIYHHLLKASPNLRAAFRYLSCYMIAIMLGFSLHLIGDLVAPGGPWGGLRLFYPLDSYIGGWGFTWWWNNYDIAIILFFAILISFSFQHFAHPLKKGYRFMPFLVLCFSLSTIGWQLSQRSFDFNILSYSQREESSKHIQRRLLGQPVMSWMEWIDDQLPVYF